MSESAKAFSLIEPFLLGNIVDIGSGGWPIVPRAIQIELSPESFAVYNSNHKPATPLQWQQDDAYINLPFKDGVVSTVFSSHLIEDYLDWTPILREWVRVLKPGGYLIVLVPDKVRWAAALAAGQPPNNAHKHESYVGELSTYAPVLGLTVVMDRFVNGIDYGIAFVARKTA